MKGKVLVALSGGVDSSVAAYLLKKSGYDVHGIFFRSWQNETELWQNCPWKEDLESARGAANHLGIPIDVVNFIDVYRKKVVDYLIEGYRIGQTPNPDIMCNRYIKFGVLVEHMKQHAFDGLATGHYCLKETHKCSFSLCEGVDKNKDQSYFLAMVQKENLVNVQFPLGSLTKPEVREIAQRIGLPNATRKDSQGICFLGSKKVNINSFLEKYLPNKEGEIVNTQGIVLGKHLGLHHFTMGQRKGINVPSNSDYEHYVVVAKDFQKNRLIVGFDHPETQGLYTQNVIIRSLNWLEEKPLNGETLLAKPRYRDPSQEISVTWLDPYSLQVHFSVPQRALALGQTIAFYRKNHLVGGGIYQEIIG